MRENSIKRSIVRSFIAILLLSVTLSAVANYHEAYEGAMSQSSAMAEIYAEIVGQLMEHQWDMDELQKSTEISSESAAYIYARHTLRSMCERFRMDYVSLYTVDPATPSRFYYFYVAADEEQDDILQQEYELRTIPVHVLLPGEQTVLSGSGEMKPEIQADRISWIALCNSEDGGFKALLVMSYDVSRIRQKTLHNFIVDIIPFSLSILLGLLVLMFLAERRIVSPISELSEKMKIFARDSRKKPEPMNLPVHDEIGEIAESFEKMTEDISSYVNNIEKLTKERTETNVQVELARRIQYSIVPAKTECNGHGFRISAMSRPAKGVGGDFYDCFLRDENNVCIVMGDVSGKGISAALCMAMIKTVIREKLMAGLGPAEALNRINAQFYVQNPENLFVTVFAGVLNPNSGTLRYASAGHTRPVLTGDGALVLQTENGIALGLFDDAEIRDETVQLSAGQGIVLYTDGLTEAINKRKEFFGIERLTEILKHVPDADNPAEAALIHIQQEVDTFRNGCEPFDDMAVLVLFTEKEMPHSGEELLPIPVLLSSFEEIKKRVFETAGDTAVTRRALVACDEVLSNVVRYSGATELEFGCRKAGDTLCITFADNGAAFDPTSAMSEEKEFEMLDGGGMGLNLIRQYASSLQYERTDKMNCLTMYFQMS